MSDYSGHVRSTLSRRKFLLLAGISTGTSALSGLLAACGGDNSSDPTPPATSTGEGAATSTPPVSSSPPADGSLTATSPDTGTTARGEVIIATGGDSYTVEPLSANIGIWPLNTNVFETLVRLSTDYQVEPMLAESWEFIEPNTWSFSLRRGITFHDGTPFTAEAVKWTFDRVVRAQRGGYLAISDDSVTVVDDYTVEITPAEGNRRLLEKLVHPASAAIIAPDSEPADTRVGTGPFVEVEYVRDDRYVVEANPDYWDESARVATITFRFIPDPTTRMLALQAGEVDIVFDVPRESVEQITSAGSLELVTSTVGAYLAMYVSIHGDAPYDLGKDPAVREAIAFAVDKEAIVRDVWLGHAEPSKTMIPSAVLGSSADIVEGTDYDPERAKQVLESAGWQQRSDGTYEKDGRPLSLQLNVLTYEELRPVPEFVQAQLKEVGIEVEIVKTPDFDTFFELIQNSEGDLWMEDGNQNDGNPCFLPDLLFYTPSPDAEPDYANLFAPGPAFDTHIDTCRTTVDTEELQESAAQAMKVLIDDEFIVIPLAGTYRQYGVVEKVKGFEAHPSQTHQRWVSVAVEE